MLKRQKHGFKKTSLITPAYKPLSLSVCLYQIYIYALYPSNTPMLCYVALVSMLFKLDQPSKV